jgi:hypothetical protein
MDTSRNIWRAPDLHGECGPDMRREVAKTSSRRAAVQHRGAQPSEPHVPFLAANHTLAPCKGCTLYGCFGVFLLF